MRSKTKTQKKHNLTKKQFMGLKELTSNPDIIIKKSDKSGAIVVMDTHAYLREGYRQLSDDKYYQKLDHDPTAEFSEQIINVLSKC